MQKFSLVFSFRFWSSREFLKFRTKNSLLNFRLKRQPPIQKIQSKAFSGFFFGSRTTLRREIQRKKIPKRTKCFTQKTVEWLITRCACYLHVQCTCCVYKFLTRNSESVSLNFWKELSHWKNVPNQNFWFRTSESGYLIEKWKNNFDIEHSFSLCSQFTNWV